MDRFALISRLAFRDFVHEWRVSACLILALATVLTPLLVLFGLKYGLIEVMTDRLLRDPRNLEIRPVGSDAYDPAWFETMRARPEVGFIVPRTRSIATSINAVSGRGAIERAELIPTAPGDPLLAEARVAPPGVGGAVVSDRLARSLDLEVGAPLRAVIDRVRGQQRERAEAALSVAAILPDHLFTRPALFVPFELLADTERYRDGFAVPRFGAEGDPEPPGARPFASFRLYAATLPGLPRLRDLLEAEGREVTTRAEEVEAVQSLDRNLSAVFWTLAGIATLGLVLSLTSSLWANVERKLPALSTLRLLGLSSRRLTLFPVIQALLICLVGSALAGGLFLAIGAVLNGLFADSLQAGEFVCRLRPHHFLIAVGATLAVGLAASALGGARAAAIEPGEKLRDA